MATDTSKLVRYTPSNFPTIDAAGSTYFTTEFRKIAQAITSIEQILAKLLVPTTVVASLPAAATAGAGSRAFVTDATATTFHSAVAGSGANKVPVVSDGTNWLIG